LLLTDLLTVDRIRIPLQARSKDEILRELVQVIRAENDIKDSDEVLRAVREREAVLSTGIGNGVAIPHGKSPVVPNLVMAAGCTAAPVEFDSLDGEPLLRSYVQFQIESLFFTQLEVNRAKAARKTRVHILKLLIHKIHLIV